MANLRRHFNFSAKSSSDTFSLSLAHKALNSLCGAGSSLARNLYHTVQGVPAYHNISQQFLSIWEDISKVTASASAAVKTETLMMLQEILNSLELCTNESEMDDIIAESFQAIGTCLCSFVELQSQFSWSTWKSLSKLSKNFSNDSMRHNLQCRSFERNQSKIFMNSHLNTNLKKHFSQLFCKVGLSKVNVTPETSQSQFYTSSIQAHENVAAYSHFGTETNDVSKGAKSVWSASSAVWATSDCSSVQYHETAPSEKGLSKSTTMPSDLDEVINLLSCTPAQKSSIKLNNENQNYFLFSGNNGSMYHLLRKGISVPQPSHLNPNISWPKERRDVSHNYDPWIWRADRNCSGLPNKSEILKLPDINDLWKNNELKKWNAYMGETESSSDDSSSAHGDPFCSGLKESFNKYCSPLSHGRHNSENNMPGESDALSDVREENPLVERSKISTWPLKQSVFRNSDYYNIEKSDCSKYSDFPFASS